MGPLISRREGGGGSRFLRQRRLRRNVVLRNFGGGIYCTAAGGYCVEISPPAAPSAKSPTALEKASLVRIDFSPLTKMLRT